MFFVGWTLTNLGEARFALRVALADMVGDLDVGCADGLRSVQAGITSDGEERSGVEVVLRLFRSRSSYRLLGRSGRVPRTLTIIC